MTGVVGRAAVWTLTAGCACGLAACSPATSHDSATPAGTSHASPGASASPTAQVIGTTRTVLSPLGLFMHGDPTLSSANHVANLQQGASVTVLDYKSTNGGWFKVMGQSTTGWIVADPTLTASGGFTPYDSAAFSALVPENWTFAQEPSDVVFRPQSGTQTIVVRAAATLSAFGPSGLPGYTSTFSDQAVVCGYTGTLLEYAGGSAVAATPSPNGSTATRLAMYAEIRLKLDATHALLIGFNYDNAAQLDDYQNFYNSIAFAFPLCEAPATPAPA